MRIWWAAMAAAALAGCGSDAGSYLPRIGILEPSQEAGPPPPGPRKDVVKRPVADITSIELGRTYGGRLLTVHGIAPAGGWFQPSLEPRNGGLPGPDGFLTYDFEAAPPDLNGGAGQPGLPVERRLIRADRAISDAAAAGAIGVRVFSVKETPAVALFTQP